LSSSKWCLGKTSLSKSFKTKLAWALYDRGVPLSTARQVGWVIFYNAGKSQWDKDTFVAEFEKHLPKRSAMLRSILEGLKSDGKFVSLCEKYLD
jgi:hypothetical protein